MAWRVLRGGALLFLNSRGAFAAPAAIDAGQVFQSIRGFGASSAWAGSYSAAQLDALFRTDTGIGLSMLRHRIPPDSNFGTGISILQGARDRGVTQIWATAWSPPGQWKNNGSPNGPGTNTCNLSNLAYLLPQYYDEYANYLASYVTTLRDSYNVNLYALSPQNEPNWCPSYEASWMDGDDFLTFTRDYLGPAFQAQGLGTRIIIPEPINTGSLASLANPCLNDAACRGYLFGIATHLYGSAPTAFPAAASNGKEYWETEISSFEAYDASMTHGLTTAGWIHGSMAASMNAFHYWWAVSNNNNEGLISQTMGNPKRYYVMGNYSKFIRPGFQRIGAPNAPTVGVNLTAYRGGTTFVIVAVNNNGSAVNQQFNLVGINVASFTPWITDDSRNLAQQVVVSVGGGGFSYDLPARSVVSFVGVASAGTATPTRTATPLPSSVMFDDFEDGDTTHNWGAGWTTYAGATSSATFSVSGPGAPGSANARGLLTGTVGGANNYAGLQANLPSSPMDLSGYIGVSFRVRGSGSYFFQLPQASITDGDHFGQAFTATGTWTTVTLYFANFTQRGWGMPATFDPTQVSSVQWTSNADGALNLEIDDIRFLYFGPTVTPSRTPASPTATCTATRSFTRTATRTASPSPTRSATPMASATASPSRTRSASPSPSATRSGSPTPTLTPAATGTMTRSPSPSATASGSPTRTPSATPSRTSSATPSRSATPSSTATPPAPTGTPSRTSSASPSATPSSSSTPFPPTSTRTSTRTPPPPTLTGIPSFTALPPSATPSPTGTAVPPSATPTGPAPTATPTGTGTVQPPSPTRTPSLTALPPSFTGTASPSGSATPSATKTASGTRSATTTSSPALTASPSVTPTSTLTPSVTPTFSPVIPPISIGSLSVREGPEAGGTSVTVSGANFSSGMSVVLGGITLTAGDWSYGGPLSFTLYTPPHAPGFVDLVVSDGTNSAAFPAAFEFKASTPTPQPQGPPEIEGSLALPNPNPAWIAFKLKGRAFKARLCLWSVNLRLLEEAEAAVAGAGWVKFALPPGILNGASGTYFYSVQALRDGEASKPDLGKFVILR